MVFNATLNTNISFIGGGNQSTRRKSTTRSKSLTNWEESMISSELLMMEVLFYVAKKCISINLIRTAASLSNCKQTKNGPEYFHAHFDGQFYTRKCFHLYGPRPENTDNNLSQNHLIRSLTNAELVWRNEGETITTNTKTIKNVKWQEFIEF